MQIQMESTIKLSPKLEIKKERIIALMYTFQYCHTVWHKVIEETSSCSAQSIKSGDRKKPEK